MNELERMCAELPPPDPAAVLKGRRRLLATIRHEDAPTPLARRSHRPWRLMAPVGLAAALALGAIATQDMSKDRAASPGNVQNVSASEILHRAAVTARSEPELHPHAGQYIYLKSKVAWGPGISHPGQPTGGDTREVWLSVDGSKPNLSRAPCWSNPARTCETPLVAQDAPKVVPTPAPGSYLGSIREVPKLLRSTREYMAHPNPRKASPPDVIALNTVDDMLGEQYLPPSLRAQIFDFLADLPGTRVEHNVADATGRRGIAVTKTAYDIRREYVFEPGTYRFLGKREIYLGPPSHITDWRRQPEGSDFDLASTVLQVKTVDHLPAKP